MNTQYTKICKTNKKKKLNDLCIQKLSIYEDSSEW